MSYSSSAPPGLRKITTRPFKYDINADSSEQYRYENWLPRQANLAKK